jgi:MFS family permease
MVGRVRIYNLGFMIFTVAAIALSFDPFHLGGGALWLISWRVIQGVGGAMLMASSSAVLTDAFPARQRGMALGINQVASVAGSFLGLLLGGLLSEWDWRAIFWVGVMRAVNTDARSTTDSRMMFTVKQIAPRRNVTCPAHHLGLGMTRQGRCASVSSVPTRIAAGPTAP